MLEKIIIDIVQSYKFSTIKTFLGDTDRRDLFLFILFCRLVDKSNESIQFNLESLDDSNDQYFDNVLSQVSSVAIKEDEQSGIAQAIHSFLNFTFRMSRKALPKGMFATLSEENRNHIDGGLPFRLIDTINPKCGGFFIEYLPEIKHSLNADIKSALHEILNIETLNNIELLSTYDALEIYSRVLLRLQATNNVMQLREEFKYEEIPSDFVDLILEIGEIENADSIYAPYEITAEQSLYMALEYPDKEIRVESIGQSHHHLLRKFSLVQAQKINCTYSYCLSANTNIEPGHYDVSLSLLQPKIVKDIATDIIKEGAKSKGVSYKEHLYIQHMLKSLNPTGKGFMVMGKGPLFRRNEKEERKLLIENNWVDAIITLPSNLMSFCPLPLVLLVLNKAKKTNDVQFINATEFQTEDNDRATLDDIDKLANEYKNRPLESPISFTVSNDDIAKNRYILNSLNYLTKTETQQYTLQELSVNRKGLLKKLVEKHSKIETLLNDE
ncbi:MAG: hypothetical protein ACI88H_001899 [Cocleimonas sp.]|jgi:hypothetical protein